MTPHPHRTEWPDTVDVDALLSTGWRPLPFREYVLKLHSRCNLACSYCYVYRMADQSWRSAPRVIERATVDRVARRIADHARWHGLDGVRVVLHGGEPLLAGADLIDHTAARLRAELGPVRLDLRMQTNGVLLDDAMIDLLDRHRIRVGVSLDGGRADNDRRRVHADGRGSHDLVADALRRLRAPRTRRLFSGLLCTIDLESDPEEVYDGLLEFDPPRVDFLLPHGNWTDRPPRRTADPSRTPYADWLLAVFDRWYGRTPRATEVRFFQEIMNLLLGGASRSETVGVSPVALLVVNTDGALEQVDTLRSAYPGAPATGLNVHTSDLDAALRHPAVAVRQLGLDSLGGECRACSLRSVCGGGYYPHRYRAGTGFANPSVYCPDLMAVIRHIRDRVRADVELLKGRGR
ncbi:FxsB family cyclophane-forming radical SAM/SPASM peptide maturase [Actinorugispora endophytica]|uniref:FxsB family cyclophane-forming radical SAM/SPASM peptide maturase n=1 Tax=Actinorugispora endophytica TaxID=1605990 RepID=UPI001FB5FA14|nr:FxsB family cyclophane-forming radical SAM/SPASM peptide maturase [Actinorugispora endophytica]